MGIPGTILAHCPIFPNQAGNSSDTSLLFFTISHQSEKPTLFNFPYCYLVTPFLIVLFAKLRPDFPARVAANADPHALSQKKEARFKMISVIISDGKALRLNQGIFVDISGFFLTIIRVCPINNKIICSQGSGVP
jgi:hypothetical protein